jgi:hypothetical protein
LVRFGNHLAFGLCDHGHDVNGQAIGFRHVASNELDTGLLEACQKMDIAPEAVELRHEQYGARAPGVVHRLSELGAALRLAALDLGVLAEHLPMAAVQEIDDRLALRVEAEPGTALTSCRDPEIELLSTYLAIAPGPPSRAG